MSIIQPVRGMPDLLGEDFQRHQHIKATAEKLAALYGFEGIATPLVEPIDVFKRSVGETSDIVQKEMYTLQDRNDATLCLRPEGTAGVMRAILSNKLTQQLPLRLMYMGPMFRYERPQKGRLRQFHQIGVEAIGVDTPESDAEIVALGHHLLQALGLKNIQLELNTLGDNASRTAYKEALVTYFTAHQASLSAESQKRLATNPLRILDSKSPQDQDLIREAPALDRYLTPAAAAHFDTVQSLLTALNIPFIRNPHLVRGLDYYCHTAFEFTTTDLGAQSAVLAGGRYDGLSSSLGGPALPSVGWAAGIERLALLMDARPKSRDKVFLVPVGDDNRAPLFALQHELRQAGHAVNLSTRNTLKHGMKQADKAHARWAVMMGDDERLDGNVTLKCMETGTQSLIKIAALSAHLLQQPS